MKVSYFSLIYLILRNSNKGRIIETHDAPEV